MNLLINVISAMLNKADVSIFPKSAYDLFLSVIMILPYYLGILIILFIIILIIKALWK